MNRLLLVTGGEALKGRIHISGSKNAAIPCLAASLLTNGTVSLHNVPQIEDIRRMIEILDSLNVKTSCDWRRHVVRIRADNPESIIPPELSMLLRGSTILMGSLIARTGHVRIEGYGGCPIGQRPIDLHLSAFEALGATVTRESNAIEVKADELKGTEISLALPSVGATENILIASAMAKGMTVLRNAAIEPEVLNLINLLKSMSIEVSVDPLQRIIRIVGQQDCQHAEHKIIPDRVEAGTYAIAAGITQGELELDGVRTEHLISVLDKLRGMGLIIGREKSNRVQVCSPDDGLRSVDVVTDVYPGFPTDMQPQLTAIATQATGTSRILETIWENRFHHIPELRKLGANIEVVGRECTVAGPTKLRETKVDAMDIRGGAALLLAALAAEGTTHISGLEHIERGYEEVREKLRRAGACVEVVDDA